MSRFTGPLAMKEFDVDRDTWAICEILIWEQGMLGSGRIIAIPIGFVFDGASIPWPLSIVLHRWGRWRRAAGLHDYLYDLIREGAPHGYAPTRKDADSEFYDAMLASGCWRVTAFTFLLAVRVFGARCI